MMCMKKLMSLVVIASVLVGCSNNVESMKDIQEKKGMDYEVTTVDGKTFLIEYDDVIYVMVNNEKIDEIVK